MHLLICPHAPPPPALLPRAPPAPLRPPAVDMEYFKNVLLRLYETGEAEALLPVVAAVLQFSPAELSRCREALRSRAETPGGGGGGAASEPA